MKKIIVFFSLFIFSCYNSQDIITINNIINPESSYSVEELVKKVLISGGNSDCIIVENVVVSPNLSVQRRNYGYFKRGNTNFPFKEGIVLSTGYASSIGNKFLSNYVGDALVGGGDVDLIKALQVENPNISIKKMYDATYIEFDFIPLKDEISFNYLLASSEYTKNYPCSYTDGFALLLKKVGDPDYVNIAVLPDNTPVSVTNIRPQVGTSCSAKNIEYYAGGYKENAGIPKFTDIYLPLETNFRGRTIPLTAKAKVEPCERYHFKFVIADYLDRVYDSAVFLEAGSFDLGVKITDKNGLDIDDDIYKCPEEEISLLATVSSKAPCLDFQWFHDGVLVPDAKTNTINALSAGTYTVVVTPNIPGTQTCSLTASVQVKEYNVEKPEILGDLYFCKGGATTLSTNIKSSSYSWSNNEGVISTDSILVVTVPGIYTLRIKNDQGCEKVTSVAIVENDLLVPVISGELSYCYGGSTELKGNNGYNEYEWSGPGIQGVEKGQSYMVSESGIYTLKVTDSMGCTGSISVAVTEYDLPTPVISGARSYCKGRSTELVGNDGYDDYEWSGPGILGVEKGQNYLVNQPGEYTLKVTNSNGCIGSTSVMVMENTIEVYIKANKEFCERDDIKLSSNAVFESYEWSDGDQILSNESELVVTKSGTYYLTVSENGCFATAQITVKSLPSPIIKEVLVTNMEGRAEVVVYPRGNYLYSLDLVVWQSSNIFKGLAIGSYKVWVKTELGCISKPANFDIKNISNIITPNGDGINDTWKLKNLSENTKVQVYNRYGKLLFDKQAIRNNETIEWNAKYLGRQVESSSYWYIILLPEGDKLTGWIAVKNSN